MNWGNGPIPFLAGTVPQLEPDAVAVDEAILEGEIVADGGGDIFIELLPHKLPDEWGFPHRATADEANFDKFVDLFSILF